jgi:hypothetical protein
MGGVPLAMQQDGRGLDDVAPATRRRQIDRRWGGVKAGLLAILIALGDVLVWGAVPGLNLAILAFGVVMAGLSVAWPRLAPRPRIAVAAGAVLALLPLVELVQPLSVLIALVGLSLICAALAGLRAVHLPRGALRVWWVAPWQTGQDAVKTVQRMSPVNLAKTDLRALVMHWAVPFVGTALFAVLLIGANPVLDQALVRLGDWRIPLPEARRVWLWVLVTLMAWPVLVAPRMKEGLAYRRPVRATVMRSGFVNAGSVASSLIAFNLLFAIQTGLDVLFLYGDAALPQGISPAAYAHRGAYPLLVTAILAGVFAVLARPHLAGRPVLRWLMLAWLAQTLALVVASVWRLEIYVDLYGLTRLRLAAYVWMGLVAVGLGIVVVQIWRDRPTAWMIARSGALGAVTLYLCAFVNFDGIIAAHNLTQPVKQHPRTLCELSEGALPAMVLYLDQSPAAYCAHLYSGAPTVFSAQDWREWGFRNWRLHRSLAAMTPPPTSEISVP